MPNNNIENHNNNSKLTNAINKLSSDYEQFKVVNDRRINELETKGSADPLTLSHLEKLNNKISGYEQEIAQLKATLNRPYSTTSSTLQSEQTENDDSEYKSAFCSYIRKGKELEIQSLEHKSLANYVDSDSGYLITSRMSDHIDRELELNSPLRRIANVTQISTDALEILDENSELQSGWTAQVTDYNKSTDVKLVKKVIPVHEIFAQPRITQKILDDPRIDIEEWISKKLIDAFTKAENKAFLAGDGKGKPFGLLRYATSNTNCIMSTGKKGEVTADSIVKLFYSLGENFSPRAKFLMSRNALQAVRMLKETNSGRYLWNPDLSGTGADTLLGAEVVECAQMPGAVADSLAIVVGDFENSYQIVDRKDVRVLRDPYTDKPFIKYYSTKRVGGDVLNTNAFKVLKLG